MGMDITAFFSSFFDLGNYVFRVVYEKSEQCNFKWSGLVAKAPRTVISVRNSSRVGDERQV